MKTKKQMLAVVLLIVSVLLLACSKPATIICGNCSATNVSDSKYCSSCGTAVFQNSTTQTTEQTQAKEQTQAQKYIGQYETSKKDACFKIYGVSDTDEIYFEADWYRLNGFGGVAKFNGKEAVFSISVGTENVVGSFTFDNNSVVLTITGIELSYIEKGQYTYTFSGEIYKESTYCGIFELNHVALTNFLSGKGIDNSNWEYCGTVGEIFKITGEEYADIFDLYCITQNNAVIYYVVKPSVDYESYEIYKVGNAGKLEKISYHYNSDSENNNKSPDTENNKNNDSIINWDIAADTWYQLTNNNVVHFQNAAVHNAVSMSQGTVFMVTYYPICKSCHHQDDTMRMKGVSPETPLTDTHYCQNCSTTTHVRFKIVY